VGLAWKGNPIQARDRFRSVSAERFLPLITGADAAFYSLQIDGGADALALIKAGLIDLTSEITDFADTAALMAELDLIIAVDTAVVHLAGALGRPVWTLLTLVPHWPWGLSGETTAWYPTMRLFRQPSRGDWDTVLDRVRVELEHLGGKI
jgi:ADP-heptose:LPS heptosyltransferase